jgi:hypothetical protein
MGYRWGAEAKWCEKIEARMMYPCLDSFAYRDRERHGRTWLNWFKYYLRMYTHLYSDSTRTYWVRVMGPYGWREDYCGLCKVVQEQGRKNVESRERWGRSIVGFLPPSSLFASCAYTSTFIVCFGRSGDGFCILRGSWMVGYALDGMGMRRGAEETHEQDRVWNYGHGLMDKDRVGTTPAAA